MANSKDGCAVNPRSPFNIKEASLTLRNFNDAEVRELLTQHTESTGQVFTEEALSEVFRLTQGQPWLVNALAKECVLQLVPDGSPITGDHKIGRYADKVGRDAMQTLVIFDRTPAGRIMPWEERLRRDKHNDVVVRWL